ncbi:SRPBCC family protein [Ferruginibacter albus]|uniref:SRPBCC family protein n=1 Tax=Ferruginibacter albus TaxID=2875540 RepID=UPI001CC46E4E|nr:SRPBCC family protein [Ferruginibacter albus]UAY50984.1 SRPBCC family protein [Ferruginibacter albus]
MKILKKILLTILVLIVLVLIAGLFIKKDHLIEREIVINKPKQEVFDYIKMIKNQDNYSYWNMQDPNMKKEYTGTDGTVGFVSKWQSDNKNVGDGEQTITAVKEGERIDMGLHFIKPFDSKASAYMITDAVDAGSTKVKWAFACKTPYPMNILCLFMNMDKMLGDQLNTGLTNLKNVLEK